MRRGLADPHKGSLDEGRRCRRIKNTKRALVREELYRRMPGGALFRCVGQEEAQRKLKEVHDNTCGSCGEASLYHKLQRVGFYWPSMGKDTDQVQTQCGTCQLVADKEESYAVFISKDWRSPFMQYLTEGILPQKHSERYKLRRLATRYFLHNGVLFKLLVSKLNSDLGMKPIIQLLRTLHKEAQIYKLLANCSLSIIGSSKLIQQP